MPLQLTLKGIKKHIQEHISAGWAMPSMGAYPEQPCGQRHQLILRLLRAVGRRRLSCGCLQGQATRAGAGALGGTVHNKQRSVLDGRLACQLAVKACMQHVGTDAPAVFCVAHDRRRISSCVHAHLTAQLRATLLRSCKFLHTAQVAQAPYASRRRLTRPLVRIAS